MAKGLKILKGIHVQGQMFRPGDEDLLDDMKLSKEDITRLQESGSLEFPDGEIVADPDDPTVAASLRSPRRGRKGKNAEAEEPTNVTVTGDGRDVNAEQPE